VSLFGLWEKRDFPFGDDPGVLLSDSTGVLNNPAYPLTSLGLLNVLGGIPVDSGVMVSEYTALRMSAVYRCVSLVASVSAALPLNTYQAGTKTVVTSSLLSNPNPDLTPFELWRQSYISRLLWGNSYQQKIRDSVGRVQSLLPITPDRVMVGRVKPSGINPSGKVFGVTDDWGSKQGLTSREILHIPGIGYDGIVGVSPIRCAAQGIGLGLAAETFAAKLFGSGNLLSGILQTEQRLDQQAAERLQERWRSMMGGLKRAHDVAILDSGASFQSLTMPSTDAEMLASRQFQLSEIGRFYGVPPYLLFDTEKSTSWGTGLEQQARGWVEFDLHPHWLAPTEQRLTKEVTPSGVMVSYNVDGLLRGDSLARATYYTAMRNVGAFSANDIRDLEDMPPVPGGDTMLQQPTGSTPGGQFPMPHMPPRDPKNDPGD
jgi:HK97 family phage portal protein